jgi:hypothetical protein
MSADTRRAASLLRELAWLQHLDTINDDIGSYRCLEARLGGGMGLNNRNKRNNPFRFMSEAELPK